MKTKKRRLLFSWVLVLVLFVNIVSPGAWAAPVDVTNLLQPITGTVNGIAVADGAEIELVDGEDLIFHFAFPQVPTESFPAAGGAFISQNDTAQIKIGKGVSGTIPSAPIPLDAGGIIVGHATIAYEAGEAVANIVFDWTSEVEELINGDGGVQIINAGFQANLEYNASGAAEEGGKKYLAILDKKVFINAPVVPITYKIDKKNGIINWDAKTIEWEIEITATQGGIAANLDGLTFSDYLAGVGQYDSGSFKVSGISDAEPAATSPTLTYTFPENTSSPKTITFKTKISDADYYSNSVRTITNTARLLQDTTELDSDPGTATLDAKRWMTKTGEVNKTQGGTGTYDPTGRTITWTITANTSGVSLNDVKITDKLPSGLTWQSAMLHRGTISGSDITWGPGEAQTDPGVNGEYNIGNITTPIQLVIVSEVPNDANGTTSSTSYNNSASITWDGLDGNGPIGSGNVGIGIGYNPIAKNGTRTGSNTDRKIRWTVTIDPRGQNFGADMKVYDLLVYGSGSIVGLVDGLPTGINLSDLTQRFNQKYAGSFTAAEGSPTLSGVHTIMQGGIAIADLVEVAVSGTAKNTFTFESQVVNPAVFAKNGSEVVHNTAWLFRGTVRLNSASDNVTYDTKILHKEVLNRAEAEAADPNAGNIGNAGNGFNHESKTAIFRISVNSDGLDFTGAGIDSGNVTVTDTLPKGWVLDRTFYKVFEGTGGSDSVAAGGDVTDSIGITPVFADAVDPNGETVAFTFTTLDKPYVILVKARLTDEQYEKYLEANDASVSPVNTATLRVEKWGLTKTATQAVTVKTKVLNKTYQLNQVQATLTWMVEYNPFALNIAEDMASVIIEDTLSEGIELRIGADGKPVWQTEGQDNFRVIELTVGADGNMPVNGTLIAPLDDAVTYDGATRTLTFKVPHAERAYRLTYVTDITRENNGPVSNQVKLAGSSVGEAGANETHIVQYQSGWASLQRGGWIEITKVDGLDQILPGAEFTLYAADGTTVIRQLKSGPDGKLKMKAVPVGSYMLKETAAPDGYIMDTGIYNVEVSGTGLNVTTSINGQQSNTLTVKNFAADTVGDLTISKTLAGNANETTKEFTFTVTLPAGTYFYSGSKTGQITSNGTITLKGGESITIHNLPKGAAYAVSENDYSGDGYAATSSGAAGFIVAGDTQNATFTNTKNVGRLEVTKTVAGNSGDKTKDFDFRVMFTGTGYNRVYTYTISDKDGPVRTGSVSNGIATFQLKHDQKAVFEDLTAGMDYIAEELNAAATGHVVTSTGAAGVVAAGEIKTASFTNTKNIYTAPATGNLTISKTVTGEGGDRTRKFEFTVSFTGASGSYPYSGASSGSLSSGGKITLAHGESITITGLPVGAAYTVTESDYTKDGYVTARAGDSGTVAPGGSYTAAFTNTKQAVKTGSLTISKTVTGEGADLTKRFEFTVTLTGAPDAYDYSGVSSGKLRSGDKITLAHGEHITITGLPEGAAYAVTEAAEEGYAASGTGTTGVIAADVTQTAAFINTKGTKPEEPGTDIGGEETPTDGREGEEFHDLDDGEIPHGYVRGPDGKLYKVLGYDEDGMPITGDAPTGAGAAIFLLLLALGGLAYADVTMRRKKRESDQ